MRSDRMSTGVEAGRSGALEFVTGISFQAAVLGNKTGSACETSLVQQHPKDNYGSLVLIHGAPPKMLTDFFDSEEGGPADQHGDAPSDFPLDVKGVPEYEAHKNTDGRTSRLCPENCVPLHLYRQS